MNSLSLPAPLGFDNQACQGVRAIALEKYFAFKPIATSYIIIADDSIATTLSRKTPSTCKLSARKALQRSGTAQEARARCACRHLTQASFH